MLVELCAGGRRGKPRQHQRLHLQNVREGNSPGELHVPDEAGPEPRPVAGVVALLCIGRLTAVLLFSSELSSPKIESHNIAACLLKHLCQL